MDKATTRLYESHVQAALWEEYHKWYKDPLVFKLPCIQITLPLIPGVTNMMLLRNKVIHEPFHPYVKAIAQRIVAQKTQVKITYVLNHQS